MFFGVSRSGFDVFRGFTFRVWGLASGIRGFHGSGFPDSGFQVRGFHGFVVQGFRGSAFPVQSFGFGISRLGVSGSYLRCLGFAVRGFAFKVRRFWGFALGVRCFALSVFGVSL